MTKDPLAHLPIDELKKLSDLFKTLKFTKKSALHTYSEHGEVKMLFDFLEQSEYEDLRNFGRYLRLLQEHEDEHQVELFIEHYTKDPQSSNL
jgi:hypothetical protein